MISAYVVPGLYMPQEMPSISLGEEEGGRRASCIVMLAVSGAVKVVAMAYPSPLISLISITVYLRIL